MSPNVNFNRSRAAKDECPIEQRLKDYGGEAEIFNTARPALIKRMIQGALSGNVALLKLCAERLAKCNGPLGFSLPEVKCVEDLPIATAAILDAAMKGLISASDGVELSKLVTIHANALRDVELLRRLEILEIASRK